MKTFALKLTLSAAIVVCLLWVADGAAVAERLRDASLAWLTLALACLTALTFLMAWRWQMTADAMALDLHYRQAVREYYIAQFVNAIIPGGIAGDVGRAIRVRHQGDLARAAQSVIAERLIGQIVTVGVMALAFLLALLLKGGLPWPTWAWLGFPALVLIAGFALMVAQRRGATGGFLRKIIEIVKVPRVLVLSSSITALLVLSFYACARATGTILPPEAWLTLIPLTLSAMLIPLSIGGWGWREGAAALLFPIAGASPSAGIATGIAFGAMITLSALPALVFIFARHQHTPETQNTA